MKAKNSRPSSVVAGSHSPLLLMITPIERMIKLFAISPLVNRRLDLRRYRSRP
jgi:hypothetical protein